MGKWILGRLLSACILSIRLVSFADANEAHISVYGGSAQLKDGNSIQIRMDSETVRIELGPEEYTVDASFEFFNDGGTTTATVGFPQFGEYYAGRQSRESGFSDFKSWVNGVEQDVRQVSGGVVIDGKKLSPSKAEEMIGYGSGYSIRKWRVKEVYFPSKEKTVTRVRYSAPYGSWRSAVYLYGTGRSWKGNMGEAHFIIKATSTTWIHNVVFSRWADSSGDVKRKYSVSRLSEYECEYRLSDFEPKEWESLSIYAEEWKQPWEEADGDFSPGEWEYSKKVIPDEMLKRLSSWQLRLFRNTFFAIHGRPFESPDLKAHFKNIWWAQPKPNIKASDLNDIEKTNVKKIADYERDNKELLGSNTYSPIEGD